MITESPWPTTVLGSVAHFYAGASLPEGERFNYQQDGYLLARVSDMNLPGNEIFMEQTKLWSAKPGPKSATCPSKSLIIPKRGGAIGTNKKRISTRPSVLDPNLMAISPLGVLDIRFLYHWFLTFDLTNIANGSSVPQLNKKDLGPLLIPLPSIETQRWIADMLDAVVGVSAKRKRAIYLLGVLAQSVFIDMFGDSSNNNSIWPTVSLGDVGDVQGGLQIASSRRRNLPVTVPYLRVANVYRGRLDLNEVKPMKVSKVELDRTRLAAGDILVVEGHGNAQEIGRAAVWDGSIDPCTHQNHLIRIRLDKSIISPVYASAFLNSLGGRRYLLRAAKTTSGLNTISVSNVKAVPLALPPMDMQTRFSNLLSKIGGQILTQQSQLYHLDALLSQLQHQAFKGELREG